MSFSKSDAAGAAKDGGNLRRPRIVSVGMKRMLLLAIVAVVLVAVLLLFLAQPVKVRTRTPEQTADEARLRATVEELVALAPRDAEHPRNLERAAAMIEARLREAGAVVERQPYDAGVPVANVIGRFGPQEGERVVLGAHYDAWGGLPGADDNASGVAVLLEVARMLGERPPGTRVDVVAYTLEEPPHFTTERMGSMVHARRLQQEGAILRGMLCLEMVGYFRDEPGTQQYPAPGLRALYGERGDFIVVAGRVQDVGLLRAVKSAMASVAGVPVHSINAPGLVPGIDFSDHASFWRHGYRAVMVTDSAFYRNPNYHTATDTPATLDYRRMKVVAEQVYAALAELAR